MGESLEIHSISQQIIGEVPVQMEWIYGVSDILLIALIIGCLLKLFLIPLEFFKR